MKFHSKLKKIAVSGLILSLVVGAGVFTSIKLFQKPANYAQASLINKIPDQVDFGSEPQNSTIPFRGTKIVPDEYIVKFKAGSNPENNQNLKNNQGQKLQIKTKLDNDTYLLENPDSIYKNNSLTQIDQAQTENKPKGEAQIENTLDTVKELKTQSQIEDVEPNHIVKIDFTPDDTFFSSQWHLENTAQNGGTAGADIKAKAAWDVTQGSSSVIVAVIDTGISLTHPDLVDKLARKPSNQVIGYNFASNNDDPSDTQGHGTHLAGIIAGKTNNTQGVAGVCPNCKIMPIKFMDNTGFGTIAAAISSINFAVANGAKILNLSWGSNSYSGSLQTAINNAHAAGVTVVASAGNENVSDYRFPADMNHVISVAATDKFDKKAFYSNYNRITVSAPGSDVLSTFPIGANISSICGDASLAPANDGYGYCTGTSMAAPVVAGLAGLIASQSPTFSPDQIAGQIMGTADNLDGLNPSYIDLLGTGRVNAYRALTETPKPMLLYQNLTVTDPAGNNNFLAEPSENLNLNISIENRWAAATNVIGVLSTTDPEINITQSSGSFGAVNFASSASALFKISLNPSVTLPKTVNFNLNLSSTSFADQLVNFNYTFKPAISIPNNFSFATTSQDWTADEIWHLSSLCATGSTNAIANIAPKYFHFGKDKCGNYDFGLKLTGNLYSPPINKLNTGQIAELSFDQFLETENNPAQYDKASVKIKTYGAADSTALTLIPAQNNTTAWENTTVSLPASITNAGLFQIFFSFDSRDGYNNAFKGWFIDNVNLSVSNNLSEVDIPNLVIVCDQATFDSTTICRFTLPSGKALPPGLKINIQNSPNSSDCILDSQSSLVICTGISTPNSVGLLPISVVLNGSTVSTGQTTKIGGISFSKATLVFSPEQGQASPIFKSNTAVTVKLLNYRNIFLSNPTAGTYVCSFDFGSIGTKSSQNPIWTSFGTAIPYDPVTGCQSDITKALRGTILNLDLRLKVCPIISSNTACDEIFDSYIYRFEGVGIASGG